MTESEAAAVEPAATESKNDLSSLSSMLEAKWKGGGQSASSKREAARTGQIRTFRIAKLDVGGKRIDLEMA